VPTYYAGNAAVHVAIDSTCSLQFCFLRHRRTDGWTDGRTDGQTDEQNPYWRVETTAQ